MKPCIAAYLKEYPSNNDCKNSLWKLVSMAYLMDKRDLFLTEFIQDCLNKYGGTIASSMIDYLYSIF